MGWLHVIPPGFAVAFPVFEGSVEAPGQELKSDGQVIIGGSVHEPGGFNK